MLYWLSGDEDLAIDVEAVVGEAAPEETLGLPLLLAIFIDGDQIAFSLDRAVPDIKGTIVTPSSPALFAHHLALESDAIADGAHDCAVVYLSLRGEPVVSWDFTILKNSNQFAPRAPYPATSFKRVDTLVTQDRDKKRPFGNELMEVEPSDPLNLQVVVKSVGSSCPASEKSFFVVALLDGVQIPLAGDVRAPLVRVEPGMMSLFDATLRELPVDGTSHSLTLLQLVGGIYWDSGTSEPSPLVEPARSIAQAFWGFAN